jgi:hypothetical protein
MIMIYQNTLAAGILPAILLLAIASTVGLIGTAFASTGNATEGTSATTTAGDTTTDATTTTGGGGGTNKIAGIIASLQLATDRIAPEWVTAGYWELESDMPLFGDTNGTEPTVTDFYAIVEMTRLTDGTFRHDHRFSDFRQSDILFTAENITRINGTMTVVTEESLTENVPTYITLQNNLISIAVDPVTTESHFGPMPITGIILASEHLPEISDVLAPTAAERRGTGGGIGNDPPPL